MTLAAPAAPGPLLDMDAFRRAPLRREPYAHMIVPEFIPAAQFPGLLADFPRVPGPGSFAPRDLDIHGRFANLLASMAAPAFRRAVEEKFALDLDRNPVTFTVRGWCRRTDGKIHRDSESKIITVLLYLNPRWETDGGRLRVLRGPENLADAEAEVPPHNGALLVFRRSAQSWHGHEPFEGRRRAVQMNWVTDSRAAAQGLRRHRWSAAWKKATSWRST